jgi:hypothetical protein
MFNRLFKMNRYKKVKMVSVWYEFSTHFFLDHHDIEGKDIRKMFVDDGKLVVQLFSGETKRIDPTGITLEYDFPIHIKMTDEDNKAVWTHEL